MKNKSKAEIQNKKIQKRKQEDREFKISLIIVCGIVAFFGIIYFSVNHLPSLIEEWKYKSNISNLSQTKDYITDEKGNNFYQTNRSVEAINTDGVFGILDGTQYYFINFMHEEGKIPNYIVEYKNETKGDVLRLETAEEITLSSFSPISADICPSTSNYPNDYFVAPDEYLNNGGNSRNDEEYINMICNALLNEEEVKRPLNQKDSTWIKLKSQKFPGLYYSVVFMTDENDIAYLYDIGSGKYVYAPDKLTVRLS